MARAAPCLGKIVAPTAKLFSSRNETDGLLTLIVLILFNYTLHPMNLLSDRAPANRSRHGIEDTLDFKTISAAFPHVGAKLAFFWGAPEFHAFIDGLQQNRDSDHRAGFPANVLLAIYRLALAHESAHPKLARRDMDPWNLSNAR